MLSDDEEIANNEQLPTEFKDMISIYNRRDKIENIVTLSLASADHSNQKSADLFNCSKRHIGESRKLQKVSKGLYLT